MGATALRVTGMDGAARNGAAHGTGTTANRNSAAWKKRKSAHSPAGQKSSSRPASRVRGTVSDRRDARSGGKLHGARKTAMAASRRKSYGIAARRETKKRG